MMRGINRKRLYGSIAHILDNPFRWADKIPMEFEIDYIKDVPLHDAYDEPIGKADVRITKGTPGRTGKSHRVFVKCGQCGSWIPFGRWHQHAGSKNCYRQMVKARYNVAITYS